MVNKRACAVGLHTLQRERERGGDPQKLHLFKLLIIKKIAYFCKYLFLLFKYKIILAYNHKINLI